MKITLSKDVLTPENGVGRKGQTIEVSQAVGHDYIKANLATEATDETEALAKPAKTEPAKVITRDTLKEDKGSKSRETKEDK